MKKNIVLIQPEIGDMDMFRDKPTPPVGLLCASTLVWKDFEIRIVDQRLGKNWGEKISDAIDKKTLCAGITTMTGSMITNALSAAKKVREIKPNLPIVWGGIHPSLLPAETAQHHLVDYVVEGEGEYIFAGLVKSLAANSRMPEIGGVWRNEKGTLQGTARESLVDMNKIPPVPYHLVNVEDYIQTYRRKRMFFYQSSRGCPRRCAYCYNRAFNMGRIRMLDAERVLGEIGDLTAKYDFSLVYFLDDNFFVNHERAFKILRGLKEMGLGCVLQGVDIESIEKLSDSELDFLEEAGVERMAVGIESGADRIRRDVLKKAGSLQSVRKQLERLKNRDIIVLCSFIIGLLGETKTEIEKTVELGLETLEMGRNFRIPQFYIFSPYPGTELYERAKAENLKFPDNLEEWGTYEWDFSNMHGKALKEYLERMAFLSKFLDRKMDDYGSGGAVLKLMYNLYRPVAWARMKKRAFAPLPERFFYETLKKVFS